MIVKEGVVEVSVNMVKSSVVASFNESNVDEWILEERRFQSQGTEWIMSYPAHVEGLDENNLDVVQSTLWIGHMIRPASH